MKHIGLFVILVGMISMIAFASKFLKSQNDLLRDVMRYLFPCIASVGILILGTMMIYQRVI